MTRWSFHTPEGFVDTMPERCLAKRDLEGRLRRLFTQYRYREIETPGMEFMDVYTCGEGFAAPEQLIKTFDQQGRILAARFDGTIPVARMAATKLYDRPLPLKLSYIEDMYRFAETGDGRQKGFTQAGVELIGSSEPEADGEVIALAIRAALTAGITRLQVSVGQVDFFKGLIEEWGISPDRESRFIRMIDAKELVAIEQFAAEEQLSDRAQAVLTMMLQGDGLIDQIAAYRTLVEHPRALRALDNLEEVLTYLEDADLLSYISIDLGMLQSLDYYTGTIFRGFTYGMGYPLFSGGRYDNVVGAFGKQMPATGFSLVIDFALTALDRQQAETGRAHAYSVVAFAEGRRVEAVRLADELRRSGEVAEICYTCHEKTAAGKWAKVREASKLFFIDETGETTEIALPIAREEG